VSKIILLAALVAALASPAFAAQKKHGPNANASETYAQTQQRPSSNPRFDVYGTSGEYIGSDPDPMVRQMLQREGN
jgi:opacity protein-like surface antigen